MSNSFNKIRLIQFKILIKFPFNQFKTQNKKISDNNYQNKKRTPKTSRYFNVILVDFWAFFIWQRWLGQKEDFDSFCWTKFVGYNLEPWPAATQTKQSK